MSSRGFKIDESANLELESLQVRSFIEVADLKVDKMQGREIKVGDKVKVKGFFGINPYYIDRVCEVVKVDADGNVTLKEGTCWKWYILELVEPSDRKTEFLQRLSALLKEYNAFLSADAVGSYCGDDVESVTLIIGIGDGCVLNYNIADPNVIITADNIMNFEKE